MQCPNCDSMLRTMGYEGIQIETCEGCGGEWLDSEELKHVVRAREVKFTPEERRAIAQATGITGVKLENVDRDLHCPKCGGTTDAVNYGGDTDEDCECTDYQVHRGEVACKHLVAVALLYARRRRVHSRCDVCGISSEEKALVGIRNDRRRHGPKYCLPHHPESMSGGTGDLAALQGEVGP